MTERTATATPQPVASARAWIGALVLLGYGCGVAFWLWAKWLFAPQLFLLPPLPPVEVLISVVESAVGPWLVALITLSSLGLIALDGIRSRYGPFAARWWKSMLVGSFETVLIHVAVWVAGTILFFAIMALLPGSEVRRLNTSDPVVRGLGLFTAFLSLIMAGPLTGLIVAARALSRQRREEFPLSPLAALNHAVATVLVPLAALWVLSGYPQATIRVLQGHSAGQGGDLPAELVSAAREGETSAVNSLLRRGVAVNAKDSSGTTALMAAAANGHREIVRTLLQSGADVDAKDASGRTALMAAAANRQVEIVAALVLVRADINVRDGEAKSALILAAFAGEPRIVRALLQGGADANAASASGETALMTAGRRGDLEIARLLLEAGADANARNAEGDTALELARRFRREEVAALLAARSRKQR